MTEKIDPRTWNAVQVRTWLHWSQKKLNIPRLTSEGRQRFPDDGAALCRWSVDDFVRVAGAQAGPLLAASLFWLKRPYDRTTGTITIIYSLIIIDKK